MNHNEPSTADFHSLVCEIPINEVNLVNMDSPDQRVNKLFQKRARFTTLAMPKVSEFNYPAKGLINNLILVHPLWCGPMNDGNEKSSGTNVTEKSM